MKEYMPKTEDEWKNKLDTKQYHIMRKRGTESAFSGKYLNNKEKGIYACAACKAILFSSDTKFDSGTGWPSFTNPENTKAVILKDDFNHGMTRTEVICKNCKSHLGHVFTDGPKGKKRFCINSACLSFKKKEK